MRLTGRHNNKRKFLSISIYYILLFGMIVLLPTAVIIAHVSNGKNKSVKIPTKPTIIKQKATPKTVDAPHDSTSLNTKPTAQINPQVPAPQPDQQINVQNTTTPTQKNPFQVGFAAWYVFNRRTEIGKTMPETVNKTFGNPDYYCAQIIKANIPTVKVPSTGDIACRNSELHVAIVERVNDDESIWISEMNSHGQKSMTDITPWGGFYQIDFKLIPKENLTNFFFVQ